MRNPEYEFIVMREFRKAACLTLDIPVVVTFTEDEEIIVTAKLLGAQVHWIMNIGSDDDEFYFRQAKHLTAVVRFPFPEDWIELEENGPREADI